MGSSRGKEFFKESKYGDSLGQYLPVTSTRKYGDVLGKYPLVTSKNYGEWDVIPAGNDLRNATEHLHQVGKNTRWAIYTNCKLTRIPGE